MSNLNFRDAAAIRGGTNPKHEASRLLSFMWKDDCTRQMSFVIFFAVTTIVMTYIVTYFLQDRFAFASILHEATDIQTDNGFPENFSQGLSFFAAGSFLMCFFQTKSKAAFFLAILCLFIWFDDSSQYHELLGGKIQQWLSLDAGYGIRGQDFGELIAWALAAAVLSVLLIWALRHNRAGDRGMLLVAAMCFAALVLFGVIFDMLHIMVSLRIMTLIEDGGEMLAMAAFCTLAIGSMRIDQVNATPRQ